MQQQQEQLVQRNATLLAGALHASALHARHPEHGQQQIALRHTAPRAGALHAGALCAAQLQWDQRQPVLQRTAQGADALHASALRAVQRQRARAGTRTATRCALRAPATPEPARAPGDAAAWSGTAGNHSTTNGAGALHASTLRALQAHSAAGKGSHNDTLRYVLARNTKVTVRKWRH